MKSRRNLNRDCGQSEVSEADLEQTVCLQRRDILGVAAWIVAAGSMLPSLSSSIAFADENVSALDEKELSVATLGVYFLKQNPQVAEKLLAKARSTANLPLQGPLNLQQVRDAHDLLVTSERSQAELEKAEVVHVAGWLLTHSEIGLALLYSSMLKSDSDIGKKV